jgi:hypothetical protein
MGIGVALLCALGAAPMNISAPPWTFTNVSAAEGAVYQGRFLTLLGEKTGLRITTAEDVANVLGLERQKQLLGCDNGESCTAEVAAALGADALVTGTLAKAGSSFVITLRGVNTVNGQPFATASARLKSEDELLSFIDAEAKSFAARMIDAYQLFVEERTAPRIRYKVWPWLIAGGGALLAGLGGTFFAISRSHYQMLLNGSFGTMFTRDNSSYALYRNDGQFFQDAGVGLMIAGGVGVVAGVVLGFVTREVAVPVSIFLSPQGAGVAVGGAW